jgi:hypothetical protein
MPDLFARLAERTLGLAPVARPLTPPVFAPAPAVALDNFTPVERTLSRAAHEPLEERAAPTSAPLIKSPPAQATPEAAARHVTVARERPLERPMAGHVAGRTMQIEAAEESQSAVAAHASWPSVETGLDAAGTSARATAPLLIEPAAETRNELVAEQQSRRRVETSLDAADTSVRATSLPAAVPPARSPSRPARRKEREPGGHTESVVEVNIGRIEVRAIFPPQPMAPVQRAADSALSLADYLKERDRGLR